MQNRHRFPATWLPEFWGTIDDSAFRALFVSGRDIRFHRRRLDGLPLLWVGDSVANGYPYVSDRILSIGHCTPENRDYFREMLDQQGAPRYEQIVLWLGNAHFVHADECDMDSYVASAVEMVGLAQRYADQVCLIAPTPVIHRHKTGVGRDTTPQVQEATAQLEAAMHEQFPYVPVFNALAFRRRLAAAGHEKAMYPDGFHLSVEAFDLLIGELRVLGVKALHNPRGNHLSRDLPRGGTIGAIVLPNV